MKKLYLSLLLLSSAFAEQEVPKPTVESLAAEITLLHAQAIQAQLEFSYAMRVCSAPDLMMAKISTLQAEKTVEETKKSSVPKKYPPLTVK